MATVLLHQIRYAASLGPSPTGEIVIDADAARTTVQLTTPDVREIVTALTRSDDLDVVYKQRDEARTKEDAGVKALTLAMQGIDRLTKERDAARVDLHVAKEAQANLCNEKAALGKENVGLKAEIERLTSGVPVAWVVCHGDGSATVRREKYEAEEVAARWGTKVQPLFLATDRPPQAAELAAKVEALGIELAREKRMREETRKDLVAANDEVLALKARVATLLSGERLTKDALAAAEKGCDNWKDRALLAEDAATKAIKDRAAAESRVKVLEGDAEPVAFGVFEDGLKGVSLHASEIMVEPLYRHPPKTGEPVAWRYSSAKFPGTTPFFLTESRRQPGLVETPLYEAPPPAAIGVTDERFAVLKSFDDADIIAADGGASDHFLTVARDPRSDTDPAFADGNASPWFRSVGSLDECRRAMDRDGEEQPNSIVRIVPINAPVVDVAAIRKALSPDRNWVPTIVRAEILAAIGDR